MAEKKKCILDYSTDNEIVGLRLVIENNNDNNVTFFTLDGEKKTVFASLFMSAADVKSSSLVIRDKKAGLDFFLPGGDKLFIGFVKKPELGIDPDDEDDPEKVRALPAPKPKPVNSFLLLSLIPSSASKAKGELALPSLTIHRDAISSAAGGGVNVSGPRETSVKDDPDKTFEWGMVTDSDDGKTVVLAWMTQEEASGTLTFFGSGDADPSCCLAVNYPKGKTFKEEGAETFAFGLFENAKTALSNGSKAMNRLSKEKVVPLTVPKE